MSISLTTDFYPNNYLLNWRNMNVSAWNRYKSTTKTKVTQLGLLGFTFRVFFLYLQVIDCCISLKYSYNLRVFSGIFFIGTNNFKEDWKSISQHDIFSRIGGQKNYNIFAKIPSFSKAAVLPYRCLKFTLPYWSVQNTFTIKLIYLESVFFVNQALSQSVSQSVMYKISAHNYITYTYKNV